MAANLISENGAPEAGLLQMTVMIGQVNKRVGGSSDMLVSNSKGV